MLDGQSGDAALDDVGVDGARRIAGRVQNNRFRPRRDLRGDFFGIGLEIIFFVKAEGDGRGAEATSDRRVSGEAGIGPEDFVAGFEYGHHRQKK